MQDNKKCIEDLHNLPKETFRKIMREVSNAKAVDDTSRHGTFCPVCGAEREVWLGVKTRARGIIDGKMGALLREC